MEEQVTLFREYLEEQELSQATIRIYMRYIKKFMKYLDGEKITKKNVINYKVMLMESSYKITTVNLNIIAVNKFIRFFGKEDCVVKTKKYQRSRSLENVITEKEYKMLLDYAKESGREKYYLIMKVIALTGIRVSELQYITVEILDRGYAQIFNKGKAREIYLPDNLIPPLHTYCEKESIRSGEIFRGTTGAPISRTAVWKMLKYMADMVGIDKDKVYPHSFRHFFALSYMEHFSNIFELADILGHSDLSVTRIYATTSIEQKRKRMNCLDIAD